MTVSEVISSVESLAPSAYQESYDNAGLIVGHPESEVSSILVTLDVTPEVVEEAIVRGANLIVAHHPIIFSGQKRLTGQNYVQRAVMLAIKNDVAIFAAHTNLDSVKNGVNHTIAQKLGIDSPEILQPLQNELVKLVTFVPVAHANKVRDAIFDAGAGCIGQYDCCSYNIEGNGTFRAQGGANPFVGRVGELHTEPEVRVETVLPKHIQNRVVAAMVKAHPYEEVAYDLYPLLNEFGEVGLGMVGNLPKPIGYADFLQLVKTKFGAGCLRYTNPVKKIIQRVAFCGGSGASLLNRAISQKADAFITADFKYHQFFDAENYIMIVDIGHYESEQFTIDLLFDYLSKNLPKFAVLKSGVKTNPVNYI